MTVFGAVGSTIRPLRADDLPAVKAVIDANGLFPPDMLDSMVAGYLAGDDADAIWLTDEAGGPVAIAYCAPERMTSGTWNLYLIAVDPGAQREGRGGALVRRTEAIIAARGAHLLLVETSGLPEFTAAYGFYRRCGFTEVARIPDFYRPGDDKIVFRKSVATPIGSMP